MKSKWHVLTCGVLAYACVASSFTIEAQSRAVPQARDNANLIVTVLDPFGAPAAGVPLLLENGPFQIPFVFEGITDVQGRFRVRVPAGKYNLSAPVEFFPGTEITVAIRQIVQRTIRMAIHATSGAFTICIDCANRQSYTPSEAVVEEFRADRDDPLSALASGAEPDVGWEFYQPPVPEALRNNASAPVGTVVVEGYVQTNGVVRDLRIVAASHPLLGSATLDSLRDMRWRPARVRGRAVEVPLHLTFEYVRATP